MQELKENPSDNKKKLTFAESLFLGCLAGGAEVAVDHPLWILKTRMQANYAFTLNPRVLYRGLSYNAICEMGITSLQYCSSKAFYDLHLITDPQLNSTCGAVIGGFASSLINTPVELGLTYQQKLTKAVSFPAALTSIVKSRGSVTSLFCGNTALSLRNSVYTYGFFTLAPTLKLHFLPPEKTHDKKWSLSFGMIAGVICSLISQPLDNIKTIQHDQVTANRNIFDTCQRIYRTSGVNGFFKGTSLRALRILLATAIIHTIVDSGEEFLTSRQQAEMKTI